MFLSMFSKLEAANGPRPSHHHRVWLLTWCYSQQMLLFYTRCNRMHGLENRILFERPLGSSRCVLSSLRQAPMFFLARSVFLFLFSLFLIEPWTLTLTGKWGLQFYRCCYGFFYDLLSRPCARGVILEVWPRKAHLCSPVFSICG